MIQRVRVMYGARWLRAAVSSAYPIQVLTVDGEGARKWISICCSSETRRAEFRHAE